MFPVRMIISFLGFELNKKDSKKSLSFVIIMRYCRIAISVRSLSDVEF